MKDKEELKKKYYHEIDCLTKHSDKEKITMKALVGNAINDAVVIDMDTRPEKPLGNSEYGACPFCNIPPEEDSGFYFHWENAPDWCPAKSRRALKLKHWHGGAKGMPRSLSREESANIIHKILFGDDMSESKPILNLEIYALADALIKAEEEKKI